MADTDRVWELMKKISICMLATWDGRELHARPMGAYVRREDNAVYFLSDARRHKDEEIKQFSKVCLAFADTGGQNYVSLAGHAEVSSDRAQDSRIVGHTRQGLVGFVRRSEHPRSQSDAAGSRILGRARQNGRLRENGRGRADR